MVGLKSYVRSSSWQSTIHSSRTSYPPTFVRNSGKYFLCFQIPLKSLSLSPLALSLSSFSTQASKPNHCDWKIQMSGLGSPSLRVGSPEVMNKILLRSSTPGTCQLVHYKPPFHADERYQLPTKRVNTFPLPSHIFPKLTSLCHVVLMYLERMQSDPPEPDDRESNPPASPRSQTAPAQGTSPMLRGSNSGGSGARRSGRSELSYVTDKRPNGLGLNGISPTDHDNEIRSDVQEGRESEAGTSVPIRTTGHVSVAWFIGFFWAVWRIWVLTIFVCVWLGGAWPRRWSWHPI